MLSQGSTRSLTHRREGKMAVSENRSGKACEVLVAHLHMTVLPSIICTMNLLLHSDPRVCQQFLELLGVAASVACVDDDGGFTLFANNELTRRFYQIGPFPQPVKLTPENLAPLLHGVRDPALVEAYVNRMKANYQACVDNRRPVSTETDMVGPDGVRWGRNTLSPVFSGETVARLFVTFIDITEIREAKDELERSLTSLIAGMVTVCGGCGRIEDDDSWVTMGEYMRRHTDRQFSHGICGECADEFEKGS